MTSQKPTIYGLPRVEPEEPFPLTPYADVHIYTPSRERHRHESTPVQLPPRRTPKPIEKPAGRPAMLSSEPSELDKQIAILAICFMLACWAMFGGYP